MSGVTIGKLAASEGVGVETVRFYQRLGLLALPDRPRGGFREYGADDQWRLAFIRRARGLGFTLAEIKDLLGTAEQMPASAVSAAADRKLAAVRQQIRELSQLECRLRRLAKVCRHGDSADCLMLRLGEPA
ncbi:MAG TPA: MerR family DNA-binding protein [Streptosporangiaceae bacterium]|jgi:MerR family mercuric resistance operon transcriptional regulator